MLALMKKKVHQEQTHEKKKLRKITSADGKQVIAHAAKIVRSIQNKTECF